MNKISLLLILSFCFWGCNNTHSKKINVSGEIKGLGNDTIYLYGTNELSSLMDTIYATKNKFSYSLSVDTLTPAMLLFNGQTEVPLFLDKGNQIEIKGEIEHLSTLQITGNTFNEEISNFQQQLYKGEKIPKKMMQSKAEEFIRQHHSSIISIYLLKKYFLQEVSPNFDKIKQLISTMNGNLLDDPYIDLLNSYIEQRKKVDTGKVAPFFNIPDVNKKRIFLSNFKHKYLLLNFWASWSDSCKQSNQELREIYKLYKKKKNFAMLGISLDINKKTWKQSIKSDTLDWQQLCDFSGWESSAAKQYAIESLPSYYLISPDGKIMLKEQNYKKLKTKLQEIVK